MYICTTWNVLIDHYQDILWVLSDVSVTPIIYSYFFIILLMILQQLWALTLIFPKYLYSKYSHVNIVQELAYSLIWTAQAFTDISNSMLEACKGYFEGKPYRVCMVLNGDGQIEVYGVWLVIDGVYAIWNHIRDCKGSCKPHMVSYSHSTAYGWKWLINFIWVLGWPQLLMVSMKQFEFFYAAIRYREFHVVSYSN